MRHNNDEAKNVYIDRVMPCYDHTTQASNMLYTKIFLYQILMSVPRVMVVVVTPVETHLDPLLVAVDLDTCCKVTAEPVQVTIHATP